MMYFLNDQNYIKYLSKQIIFLNFLSAFVCSINKVALTIFKIITSYALLTVTLCFSCLMLFLIFQSSHFAICITKLTNILIILFECKYPIKMSCA